MRRWLVGCAVVALGCGRAGGPAEPVPAPPPAGSTAVARPPAPAADVPVHYARYVEPCGRSLLEVAPTPAGPFTLVQPVGPGSPTRRLRYHTLVTGRFRVQGRLTGAVVDDHHCGAYPELRVEDFAPWGAVKRCTSIGSLDPELHRYTEDLPTDRYVSSDFEGGGELPLVDDDSCVPRATGCVSGLAPVTACDGRRWCCRVRPAGT